MDPMKMLNQKKQNKPPPLSDPKKLQTEVSDKQESPMLNEDPQSPGLKQVDLSMGPAASKRREANKRMIPMTEDDIQMVLKLEEEDRLDEENRYKDLEYIVTKIRHVQERQMENSGKKSEIIKSWVSKKKKRFEDSEYNLDLTCKIRVIIDITDKIIAMGYPSQGFESIYRNNLDQVKQFLDRRHTKQNYKVYNLCCEKERQYPEGTFPKMASYGFHDHNPPSIHMMDQFCRDVVSQTHSRNSSLVKTFRTPQWSTARQARVAQAL